MTDHHAAFKASAPSDPSRPAAGFASELLVLLTEFGRRCPLPRVKALHLPSPVAAGTKDGEFCALELDDGSLGLSYVLLDGTLEKLASGQAVDGLAGAPALDVAQTFATASGARRAIGFAAANALSQCLFTRAGFVFDHDTDSIGQLSPGPDDHVGMIGFFTPLVPRIVDCGARLTIAELDPGFVGERDGYRVTLDARELSTCNKVLSTSTVLLNDTLDAMLGQCTAARWFAMVGPSAGCLPDPLFARGVSSVGGVRVVNRDAFVAAMTGGERWGPFARKYAIARADYPGAEDLIARAAADARAG